MGSKISPIMFQLNGVSARSRLKALTTRHLEPIHQQCWACGQPMWVAYHTTRTVTTLEGCCQLVLRVRRCRNRFCQEYHRPYRPEEEGSWALPHGEFGLDIIALVGALRIFITGAFLRSIKT